MACFCRTLCVSCLWNFSEALQGHLNGERLLWKCIILCFYILGESFNDIYVLALKIPLLTLCYLFHFYIIQCVTQIYRCTAEGTVYTFVLGIFE